MKRFIELLRKHWIGAWVIASIGYALVIHIMFCIEAKNKYLVAHWSAGDLLSYTGTVTLGLLALWQNKKLQEENDTAQKRLENISLHANEISIINRIVEYQTNRINMLKKTMDDFVNACNPQAIALAMAKQGINNYPSVVGLTELETEVDNAFFALSRAMREDKDIQTNDEHPLKIVYAKLYQYTKETIKVYREGTINIANQREIEIQASVLGNIRDEFLKQREKYLFLQENKLQELLFKNMTLKEIRELFPM